MKQISIIFLFYFLSFHSHSQEYKYGNETYTYPELIDLYKILANKHKEISLYNMGMSDFGLPIYVCLINAGSDSLTSFENARKGTTILINNAIHPGEPDGVNACVNLIKEWILYGKPSGMMPIVAIIPAYNVGGMMNRSSTSRANQNGPKEYGFRGNANNLDLNRDFIKMDSKNAETFTKIFHALDPDIFIDTHVSNGADYQYTLSMISSMRERLAPSIAEITYEKLLPTMSKNLKKKGWDLMQYVELKNETPDEGIVGFNDLPRYASGYASLFNCLSFTIETHMLKPFNKRVNATEAAIFEFIRFAIENKEAIEIARKDAVKYDLIKTTYPINYKLQDKFDSISFRGYEAKYKESEISGLSRLYYDVKKPYEKYISNYHFFETKDSIKIPEYYIITGQNQKAIDRLVANNVSLIYIEKDSLLNLYCQKIESYDTGKNPYEGHYLHTKIVSQEIEKSVLMRKGDVIVSTNQKNVNYIVNTLDATAEDGFFAWNFFDSYLQQKEYFSSYVFEDLASELLKKDKKLKEAFDFAKANDLELQKSGNLQLKWIYDHSDYKEQFVNILPIFKLY